MTTISFIAAQGTQVLAEQSPQKQEVNYDEINNVLLREKYPNFSPTEGINKILQNQGKDILIGVNEYTFSKDQKRVLEVGVEHLEMIENSRENKLSIKDKIEKSKQKILKPTY